MCQYFLRQLLCYSWNQTVEYVAVKIIYMVSSVLPALSFQLGLALTGISALWSWCQVIELGVWKHLKACTILILKLTLDGSQIALCGK